MEVGFGVAGWTGVRARRRVPYDGASISDLRRPRGGVPRVGGGARLAAVGGRDAHGGEADDTAPAPSDDAPVRGSTREGETSSDAEQADADSARRDVWADLWAFLRGGGALDGDEHVDAGKAASHGFAKWLAALPWVKEADEAQERGRDAAAQRDEDGDAGAERSEMESEVVRFLRKGSAAPPDSTQTKSTNAAPRGESPTEARDRPSPPPDQRPAEPTRKTSTIYVREGETPRKALERAILAIPQKDIASIKSIFGSETFFATETLDSSPGVLAFRGNLRGEPQASVDTLQARMNKRGLTQDKYEISLRPYGPDNEPLVVVKRVLPRTHKAWYFYAWLAYSALAFFQTDRVLLRHLRVTDTLSLVLALPFFVRGGVHVAINGIQQHLVLSLAYCGLVLSSILIQRLVAKRLKIKMGPWIHTVLTPLGRTWIDSVPRSRTQLFQVAAAGLGTLWLFSSALFLLGLSLTTVSSQRLVFLPTKALSQFGLLALLSKWILGDKLPRSSTGSIIGLHQVAVLGAAGLVTAAFKSLPCLQSDGVRMMRSIHGKRAIPVFYALSIVLVFLVMPDWFGYSFAFALPPLAPDRDVQNEVSEPGAPYVIAWTVVTLQALGVLLPMPRTLAFP